MSPKNVILFTRYADSCKYFEAVTRKLRIILLWSFSFITIFPLRLLTRSIDVAKVLREKLSKARYIRSPMISPSWNIWCSKYFKWNLIQPHNISYHGAGCFWIWNYIFLTFSIPQLVRTWRLQIRKSTPGSSTENVKNLNIFSKQTWLNVKDKQGNFQNIVVL